MDRSTRCVVSRWIGWVVVLACAVSGVEAEAQGELGGEVIANDAFATVLGPQMSVSGPPTALQVQAQYWHRLSGPWAFHSGLGMTFSGQTSLEGDQGRVSDYDSTMGMTFAAGARLDLDLGWYPINAYVRADMTFEFVTSDAWVGYLMGPSMAFGVAYPLTDSLGLLAEVETTTGYGLFQSSGSVFAWTIDALIGAQVSF
jgi:hypothetical protein